MANASGALDINQALQYSGSVGQRAARLLVILSFTGGNSNVSVATGDPQHQT